MLSPAVIVAFSYIHDFPLKEFGVGRNLVPVSATILDVNVVQIGIGRGRSFQPLVKFEYVIDKSVYTSNKIAIYDTEQWRDDAVRKTNKYQKGMQVKAYFSEKYPEFAVLNPRFPWGWLLSFIVITFLTAILGVILGFLLFFRKRFKNDS